MSKPNILIFMTDHQRADTVLPSHPAQTPNLDRFAQQGVQFTNTFCPSPHCCPSRATFFSGLYPTRHGVWNNVCNRQALSRGLSEGVRLWSEDLAEAGYRMHFCGKWHVSVEERPSDRGWVDEIVSATEPGEHATTWPYYRDHAQQPMDTDREEGEILRPGYGTYRLYGTRDEADEGHDERVVARAVELLPELAAGDDPWALYVGVNGPHDPYVVPQRFLDLYDLEDVPLPPSFGDELVDKPSIYQRMRDQIFGQLSPREVREGVRHFWAFCSYLDYQFGQVIEALDRTGQASDTLVLYCSDHADYCGDHGLFCKGIPCFQGAYRVPAVVRWPKLVASPGRDVDAFVSLADFAPTFIEAAGLSAGRHFVGVSLLPFLRGDPSNDWRDEIHTQCNGVELYYTQRSVMTRDFKYVFNGFDRDELYDLRVDPHEMANVADDSAYAEVKKAMSQRMWRFAHQEDDTAISKYITVGLAPYGPAEAFR
jgi:arylsulfatase A-like enzyme